MVVIVGQPAVSVEQLASRQLLPSVDALRPASCPCCGQPSRPPGERLGIVGHGTYTRHVLGVVERARQLMIWVRRYLCRGCRKTISVLPDTLYPGRWYAGVVVMMSLVLGLLRGVPADEIRRQAGGDGEGSGWKTLRRWQRQLLSPMWSWLAPEIGCTTVPARSRDEQVRRLRRLMALHSPGPPEGADQVETVAVALVRGTAHDGAAGWPILRGWRGSSSLTSRPASAKAAPTEGVRRS